MIVYEGPGNLFNTSMQTLVCPVNCRGVMGAGLALAFKQRFPGLFLNYYRTVQSNSITINKPVVVPIGINRFVLCFATKIDWRDDSKTEYVEAGLKAFAKNYESLGVTTASFPMLGCGKGNLDYMSQVRPLMHQYLDPLPIEIEIIVSPGRQPKATR